MTQQTTSGSTTEPVSPYDAPPAWTPAPPAAAAPVGPTAKPTFRDRLDEMRGRVVKLWLALAVGAACLVAGLGLGAWIGHATTGSGSNGQPQSPGIGSGQRPDGDVGGRGFGGQDGH